MQSVIIAVQVIEGVVSPSHNTVELFEVKGVVSIPICLFQHLAQFLVRQFFSHFGSNLLQIFVCNFVKIILVEQLEDF